MPYLVTIWIARLAGRVSQLLGRGEGATIPGYLAEDMRPQLLEELGRQLDGDVILITGTNGKTTTTKMVREMLEASGQRVLNNQDGSNLARGVLTTLMAATDRRGRIGLASAVLEVDEAALPAVATALRPRLIVVLNLFRDQLDRYGELDTTAELIGQAIKRSRTDVLLNADDPLVASLARYADKRASVRYFGIEAEYDVGLAHDHTADSTHDPLTGEPLQYSRVYFGHLGHYQTRSKRLKRPQPDVCVASIKKISAHGSESTLMIGKDRLNLRLALPGLYNLYNALTAIATGDCLGLDRQKAVDVVSMTGPAFGRVETLDYRGRRLQLLLIKNPTGFNQVIQTFLLHNRQPVAFLINDNFADGRDVSWLWDAAIEDLPAKGQYWVGGLRAADMALRLKYAGRSLQGRADGSLQQLLDEMVASTRPSELIYIVPTYTAMLELRRLAGAGRSRVAA